MAELLELSSSSPMKIEGEERKPVQVIVWDSLTLLDGLRVIILFIEYSGKQI